MTPYLCEFEFRREKNLQKVLKIEKFTFIYNTSVNNSRA